MKKIFDNVDRDRYYGLRVGDTVNLRGLDGKTLFENAEVISYGFMDNNRITVKLANDNETNWVAEWCEIVTRVEDKSPKRKNLDLKNADFRKYYNTTMKRNIWVLGYFGGGAVNVMDAMLLASEYSNETNVPIGSVCIDEILRSRRFKGFKFLFSTVIQDKCEDVKDADVMRNVYKWLSD
jgi:hypothetical protein